jgi:hypothetical protein
MAVPETFDLVPGFVTVTVLVMFQVNADVVAVAAWESVAVTVAEHLQAVVGVPEIAPVEALIERPAGSPVTE